MTKPEVYSVSALSDLAGVSVRTLHHYDSVGLLKPQRRDNGYREYDLSHVIRLQQIIIYRELDFSIEDIMKMLDAKGFDLLSALESQKALLLERQRKTHSMINSVEATMKSIQAKQNIEILFEDLPKEKVEDWDRLMQDHHGIDMASIAEHVFGGYTADEAKALKANTEAFTEDYLKVIHLPVDSPEVQARAEIHHEVSVRMMRRANPDRIIDLELIIRLADHLATDETSREIYSYYHEDFSRHLGNAWRYYAEKYLTE